MASRWTTLTALAGLGAWVVFTLITWLGNAPLGHDESQYAIAARDVLAGDELRWFYLSRGMNGVAAPGIWLGGSEAAMRFLPFLFGIGFVLATYWVARRVVGAVSAAWALVVLASSRGIVRLGTDLLSDTPAAACLLGAFAIIVDEVDREDGPRWRLLWAAPLLAAALYIRYGSAVFIAVIVVASIIVGARTMVRRIAPVLATAVLFLVLLIPHFWEANRVAGGPLGILLASRGVPQQDGILDGLRTYLTSNPFRYYGLLTPFVLVAGVVALRIRNRRRLLAWLVGIGAFIGMGLTTHGMLRYILFPVAILVVLGTDQLRTWLAPLPRAVKALVVALLAVAYFLAIIRQPHADDSRRFRMRGTLAAARAIRADAQGRPCTVIGYHFTQLEWYSGCRAPLILDGNSAAEAHARGDLVYLVRDYTPTWVPAWQPMFTDYPGTFRHILALPAVTEVVHLSASRTR